MARTVPKKLKDSALLRATLREVARRQSAATLTRQGYSYIQVAQALATLIGSGLILEDGRGMTLTKAGNAMLQGDIPNRQFVWLDPLEHRRVAKLEPSSLYVPGRRSLKSVKSRISC
jgi:hypothetical protein